MFEEEGKLRVAYKRHKYYTHVLIKEQQLRKRLESEKLALSQFKNKNSTHSSDNEIEKLNNIIQIEKDLFNLNEEFKVLKYEKHIYKRLMNKKTRFLLNKKSSKTDHLNQLIRRYHSKEIELKEIEEAYYEGIKVKPHINKFMTLLNKSNVSYDEFIQEFYDFTNRLDNYIFELDDLSKCINLKLENIISPCRYVIDFKISKDNLEDNLQSLNHKLIIINTGQKIIEEHLLYIYTKLDNELSEKSKILQDLILST